MSLVAILFTVAFAIIMIYVVATLITLGFWNLVLVPIFHVQPIEWWQALLIYFFIGLIAGVFRATARTR